MGANLTLDSCKIEDLKLRGLIIKEINEFGSILNSKMDL